MAASDEKIKELLDQATDGIKAVFESDNFKNYLTVMSRFHNYSPRNSILIAMQKPDATHVAGYQAWISNFKRQVQKGEKGISIIAYAPKKIVTDIERKTSNGETVRDGDGNPITDKAIRQIPCFKVVHVYDISQTAGEPLPHLVNELTGTVENYKDLTAALQNASPFPIEYENMRDDVLGYCDPLARRIAIKEGMSEPQTVKTIIHEIAHADLHAPELGASPQERIDRRTKEVEAECIAFVVCEHCGVDTSDYSFPYIAAWSSNKELKELEGSLDRIQKQSNELISRIHQNIIDIRAERDAGQNLSRELRTGGSPADRTFAIYQMPSDNPALRGFRFEGINAFASAGIKPMVGMYELVHEGTLPQGRSLHDIFSEFNIKPTVNMRSLSMSDIILIEEGGQYTASYIDAHGFTPVPSFAEDVVKNLPQDEAKRLANEALDSASRGDSKLARERRERFAAAEAAADQRSFAPAQNIKEREV